MRIFLNPVLPIIAVALFLIALVTNSIPFLTAAVILMVVLLTRNVRDRLRKGEVFRAILSVIIVVVAVVAVFPLINR